MTEKIDWAAVEARRQSLKNRLMDRTAYLQAVKIQPLETIETIELLQPKIISLIGWLLA